MNNVNLMGRLVADPEMKKTTNGKLYCNFSLVKNTYIKNGEQRTDYFDCVAWNGTAERLAKYCNKGDNIAIVGSLQNNNYTTAEGEKRYGMRIVVREVYFAGRKNNNSAVQTDVQLEEMMPDDYEDVPFN